MIYKQLIEEGLYISDMLAANWLPWICLAMIGLLWLCCMMQPQYLRGLVSNSFATFDNNAAEQIPSIGSQVSQWLFNIVVPVIGVYSLVVQEAEYGIHLFNRILLLALLIDVVRTLIALLVMYTFRLGKVLGLLYMRYFSLRAIYSCVLVCEILLVSYSEEPTIWITIMAITMVIYLIILGVQWARLLCSSLLEVVSVLVYLLTIELLPLLLLYAAAEQMYM